MSSLMDGMDEFNNIPQSQLVEIKEKERQEQARESFRQANASAALEGLIVTSEELAIQEEVIMGRINHNEALIKIRALFGLND